MDKIEVTQADKNCARNIRNAWDVNCNTAYEIAALHRLAHTQQSDTQVAWMYEQNETCTMRDKPFIQFNRAHMDPKYWTETPLYPHPPATDVAALVEALKCIQRLADRCSNLPDTDGLRRAYRDIDVMAQVALAALKDRTNG